MAPQESMWHTVERVIAAGAVGINLEDNTQAQDPAHSLFAVEAQAERIAAAREAAEHASIHMVINARTDTYLAGVSEGPARLAETIRRGGVRAHPWQRPLAGT